jgi:16S rRNA (adenine1518-N6/adenine1519-N6)-dimethyltransferase
MHVRKHLGQHFLCDQGIIQQIVAELSPQKNEHLIEIGPGQGALTLPVLKRVKYLEAIELDRDLILPLKARCEHAGQLHIYSDDALTFNFASIKQDERKLRIFGNLPYNIGTPLIFHLLTYSDIITDMLFMLQKEVAERLAANANTKPYGSLSIMVQFHCKVELLFNVPANAFYPPPKVTSSLLRLIPHREFHHLVKDYDLFAAIVKHAFNQRRKTLRNSLKNYISDDMWKTLLIRSDLRAENISLNEFIEISNFVYDNIRNR